jgi:anti-anti-sigma regulatory factor
MVFSFFRKAKQDEPAPKKPVVAPATEIPAPKTEPEPAAKTQPAATLPSPAASEEVVVFERISAEGCSVVEEAAVYYANNLAAQAVATLSQYIQETADKKEMQPWLMLFELYQQLNNHLAFNELSMQFVVKFERSAPVWKGPLPIEAPVKKVESTQKDLISLGSTLAAGPALERIAQLPKGAANVRISVSNVVDIELEGAELLQRGLQSCRKKGLVLQLEGVERLVAAVKKQMAVDGHGSQDRLAWLLLFELYQWMGKEAEYEDLAIEYAVTFEISPPGWEPIKPALAAAQAKPAPPPPAPSDTVADDLFSLRGVISESSQGQLQDLANFAAGKQEVRINMGQVPRVDFVAVGNLMGTLISLTQAGKTVMLFEANELIQALFNVMGVSEFATLMRKKAR